MKEGNCDWHPWERGVKIEPSDLVACVWELKPINLVKYEDKTVYFDKEKSEPNGKFSEVWISGYSTTGNSSLATMVTSGWIPNDRDAVDYFMELNPDFNSWSCGLFDNEKAARVSFG